MEKQLPKNWVETELGIVAELTSGYGFPIKFQGFTDYEIPFFKVGDISENFKKGNVFLETCNNYINEDILKSIKAKKLPSGSIVFAKIGEAIRLNRRAITTEDCVVDNNVMALKFNNNVLFKYGYYFFQTVKLIDLSAGNAVPSIRKSVVEKLEFPLPPLAEQNRIVAKLDSLFAQLETIKTSMATIPVLLKNFRQQVLTQAVTGKLTESWRVGRELEFAKISFERNEDYKLHEIPNTWKHAIISNISKVKGGKRLPKGEELVNENTGYPYIRARDLKKGTVLTKNLMFLEEKTQIQIKNYIVNEGDLYITIVGAKIGDAGLIPKKMQGANLTENAVKITDLNENIYNEYFSIWLRSSICQNNIQQTIMSAAQGKLAITRINQLPIYLPNLKEQQEIVSRVESLFAKADAIEKQYETLKQKIEILPQAILHKSFKGELVEQLDTDGDARELLQQIQELKEQTAKVVKKKVATKKAKEYKQSEDSLGMVAESNNK